MSHAERRRARGEATREALLDAARTAFGSRGYSATSLRQIVEAASVTKGAFYHHFEDKQAVFAAVFADVQRDIARRAFVVHLEHEGEDGDDRPVVRDLVVEPDEQVLDHLVQGCRTYLEAHLDRAVQRIVLIDGRAVLPWGTWHESHTEHAVVLLRADLRRAMRRGLLDPLPLRPLSTMLAGALDEGCMSIAHGEDPGAALEEAMQVITRILQGLRATDPRPG